MCTYFHLLSQSMCFGWCKMQCGRPGFNPWVGKTPREGKVYPLQFSWAFLAAQLVKNLPGRRSGFEPCIGKIPWRRERLPTPVLWPGEFHESMGSWLSLFKVIIHMYNPITIFLTVWGLFSAGRAFPSLVFCLQNFL